MLHGRRDRTLPCIELSEACSLLGANASKNRSLTLRTIVGLAVKSGKRASLSSPRCSLAPRSLGP